MHLDCASRAFMHLIVLTAQLPARFPYTTLYYTILYYTVMYYIILHYTILYYPVP
jgi:hypothetical protein